MSGQVFSFQQVIGQQQAIQSLQSAFAADRWSHAYVFSGPVGVGRSTVASAWARLLLCSNPILSDQSLYEGCGGCGSCVAVERGTHPDLHLISKELHQYTTTGRGSNGPVELRIDVVREFLIAKAFLRPSLSTRRVFIISEADKLNTQAQNAMLKVLEEPPVYCCIILICSRLEGLLPTIRSRSAVVRFGPLDHSVVQGHLLQMGLPGPTARYLAFLSRGSIGIARLLARIERLEIPLQEVNKAILTGLLSRSACQVIGLVESVLDYCDRLSKALAQLDPQISTSDLRRRSHRLLISVVLLILEDMIKLDLVADEKLVNIDHVDLLRKLVGLMGKYRVIEAIEQAYLASAAIEAAANERLVWERFLLRLGL